MAIPSSLSSKKKKIHKKQHNSTTSTSTSSKNSKFKKDDNDKRLKKEYKKQKQVVHNTTNTSNKNNNNSSCQKNKVHNSRGSNNKSKNISNSKSKSKTNKNSGNTPTTASPKQEQSQMKPKRLFESQSLSPSLEVKKKVNDKDKMDIDNNIVVASIQASSKKARNTKPQNKKQKTDKGNKKNKAIVESYIHRINHISTKPNTILKMSLYENANNNTSTSMIQSNNNNSLLAISRDDGSIELLQLNDKNKLLSLVIVPGITKMPMDNLVCCKIGTKYKFFCSSTKSNNFHTINFEKLSFTHITPSNGGSIVCMKPYTYEDKCYLACGCQDGFIRIWDVTNTIVNDGDDEQQQQPVFLWKLPTAGNAILSLTWKEYHLDQHQLTIFASIADATIRRYDYIETETSGWKQSFRSTIDTFGTSQDPTRIWCIQHISNHDQIVTGDSYGQIQYWNDKTGLLECTIKHNNYNAALYDIICTQSDYSEHDKVYATGVDSTIACMIYDNDECTWRLSTSKRLHTHDIKTMIYCKNNNALVTGGLDTKIGICTLRDDSTCSTLNNNDDTMVTENDNDISLLGSSFLSYKLYDSYFYYQYKLQLSNNNKMISYNSINDDNLCFIECIPILKNIASTSTASSSNTSATNYANSNTKQQQSCVTKKTNLQNEQTYNTKLSLQITRNILSCTLSAHGDLLLFCTTSQIGLFYLHVDDKDTIHKMNYLPINFSNEIENIISGSTIIQFLHVNGNNDNEDEPERVFICVTAKDIIMVKIILPKDINISTINNDIQIIILQTIPLPKEVDSASNASSSTNLFLPIYTISLSNDNKWFALLQHTFNQEKNNLSSSIHIYQIDDKKENQNDMSHYWTMHPPSSSTTTTTTITIYNDTLLLSNTTFTLFMYDLIERRLSDWNTDNNLTDVGEYGVPNNFYDCIGTNIEYPTRIIPIGTNKCIMASYNFFYIMDLDLNIPRISKIYPSTSSNNKENKGDALSITQQGRNFTICKRYKSIMCMNSLVSSQNENELIIIELSQNDMLKRLSNPLERKEYGT